MTTHIVQEVISKGFFKCPHCDANHRAYKRRLNVSMAATLILMSKKPVNEFFHVEEYLHKIRAPKSFRADFHKLRFWGLIHPQVFYRADGSSRNGYYCITQAGVDFVKGALSVPEYLILLDNEVISSSPHAIKINEALKEKFNYNDIFNLKF